jgi:hypothetical protein
LYTFKNSTLEQLTALKAVLEGKKTVKTVETISIDNVRSSDSREYGTSKALFDLARQIGLTEKIYRTTVPMEEQQSIIGLLGVEL